MPEARPNLLFVFTDQQSALAMGGPRQPWVQTPALQSLAARGVSFSRAYCAAPVCGPSRACLLTGRAPHETGVRWNGQTPAGHLPTFGQTLRQSGYETAWAGKWHLPKSYPTEPDALPGFENLTIAPDHPLLQRDIGYGWPGFALGANTDAPYVDQALRFLHRPHRQPFLLAVSLHNPHDICWWVRKPRRLPGPPELPPLPANFAVSDAEPELLRLGRQRDHYGEEIRYTTDWSEEDWRLYLHAYYRMTEDVDAQVGRLLDALRATGQQDNTLVIFTSDHGEGMAAHQWVAKLAFHEEIVRVPLIVAGPGVRGHGRVDATSLVGGLDLFPTLCDFAHVRDLPATRGRSLRPLLETDAAPSDCTHLVCTLDPDNERPDLSGRLVITPRYKYCAYSTGPGAETLHDLQVDPGEQRDLARDPAHRETLAHHRHLLDHWKHETGDPFPGGT
jgi:arylsulfatase A-like enzyme